MGKSIPSFLCGGISAGEWGEFRPKSFARGFYLSRCNNIVLEAIAPYYHDNNMPLEKVYSVLKKFISPILDLDLWVTLHLTNGNDDTIPRFGAMNIAEKIVGKLINDFGPNSRIIICPIAENSNQPNEEKLVRYCLDNWAAKGGHLIFNNGGRPRSLPGGYSLLDYHTQSGYDYGPQIGRMTLIDTDNGPIISFLRYGAPAGKYWSPDRVREFSTKCKQAGNGINLYAANCTMMNLDAMNVVGSVYNVRPKPSFIDKIIMEIKLLKY